MWLFNKPVWVVGLLLDIVGHHYLKVTGAVELDKAEGLVVEDYL